MIDDDDDDLMISLLLSPVEEICLEHPKEHNWRTQGTHLQSHYMK